ncbi:WbqC family protein [Roseivirga sp.]|uniref:WbqC family protein n=1 Tax=Roseivirga sp. TaxID=1964215 RepID=UPI003B51BC53
MKILLESQYFPPIASFVLMAHSTEIWIEAHEHFEKQTYRNRCEILGANGIQRLTVPVRFANSGRPIQSMSIDHRQKWLNNHWRAIQSAYGKAPFYDYYADYIQRELFKPCSTVFELNNRLLTLCLKMLNLPVKINFTEKYELKVSEDIFDFRSTIHPKKGHEGLTWFRPESYYQVFGNNFVPNLSVLDLLFCMGPDALMVLKRSGVFSEN